MSRIQHPAWPVLRSGAALAFSGLMALLVGPTPAAGAQEAPRPIHQRDVQARNVVYDPALFSGLHYRMAGPFRAGRSTAVTGIPSKPFTYFMGTTGGGIWKTDDAGQSWANVSDGFFGGDIGAVNVAEANPSIIYVGTGSACIRGNVSPGHGVYKSEDGGKTWTYVGLPDAGQIGRIAVHPRNPDVVYVAALGHPFGKNPERGVYRSTDGGKSWDHVLFVSDSTGAVDLAMNPENPNEIYAGMWRGERKPWTLISGSFDSGVYKTTNGGETWTKLGGGLPTGLVGKVGVTVSRANPERVWVLIQNEPNGGVYRSDDGGKTWVHTNDERKLRQRAFYYTHIYADPQDEHTVWALNTRLYRSVDDGRTFEQIGTPHGDVHDLWLNPDNHDLMIVANDGGGQVTVNGGRHWSSMYNQPTAQFYRVTVDNQWPYRMYAGQQDNSTISVPAWWVAGISPEQFWREHAGGESAHVAVDPRNPNITYATAQCCGDWLAYKNQETGYVREIVAYPQVQGGLAAENMKYRIQWNNPVRVDPHNPDVVYHGTQYLLKTEDGGQTWQEISPDLTGNDLSQQYQPGEPIDNDVTGVETYNTIFALEVSPDEPGVIWTGSDDGVVHVTRDGGASWTNVTPDGMPEDGTVNAIDISPHRPGKAYIAVYNYRMDDFTPYIFRTNDYGESWQRLTNGQNGIPPDHFVRVVREDPDREGLLYAGTEFGMYISFDDGAHWQPFQLDLPRVPITDLQVHQGDLVVATQGRAFWILDDLTPLHELDRSVANSAVHLYQPADAFNDQRQGVRGADRWPENRPQGAFIHYWLAADASGEVTLELLEEDGDVIRTFTSDSAKAAEGGGEPIPAGAGMHRLIWDLRYPDANKPDDVIHRGDVDGYRAPPGSYQVQLTANGTTQTRSFQVLLSPRLEREGVTRQDLVEQATLAAEVQDTLNTIYDALRDIRFIREQTEAVVERARYLGQQTAQLEESARRLQETLTALEQDLYQTKYRASQDTWNYPPRVAGWMATIYEHVAEYNARPNEGTQEAFRDWSARWSELRSRLDQIVRTDVAAFNRQAEGLRLPAIVAGSS